MEDDTCECVGEYRKEKMKQTNKLKEGKKEKDKDKKTRHEGVKTYEMNVSEVNPSHESRCLHSGMFLSSRGINSFSGRDCGR